MKYRNVNGVYSGQRQNALAVAAKIKPQFPDSGEGRFMFAIVEMAILDTTLQGDNPGQHYSATVEDAKEYLRGDMRHAQLAGVDPDWIRSLLKRVGLSIAPF